MNISNIYVKKKKYRPFGDLLLKFEIEDIKVDFEHIIEQKKYNLPFELESNGTQRFYGLAGMLAQMLSYSTTLVIDELEYSLHPNLFTHFLLMFLVNSKDSQIIATTHNREILNDKNLFREDTIWFTQKDNQSATILYPLADLDSSKVRDTTNALNAYKAGKLGGIPNLGGDYYLDL